MEGKPLGTERFSSIPFQNGFRPVLHFRLQALRKWSGSLRHFLRSILHTIRQRASFLPHRILFPPAPFLLTLRSISLFSTIIFPFKPLISKGLRYGLVKLITSTLFIKNKHYVNFYWFFCYQFINIFFFDAHPTALLQATPVVLCCVVAITQAVFVLF